MINFTVLEDSSPYYIRYKHSLSDSIIDRCRQVKKKYIDSPDSIDRRKFKHIVFPNPLANEILGLVYKSHELNLNLERISLFITQAGHYYKPHKDGLAARFGINYTVDISDDLCQTSWYADDLLEDRVNTDFYKNFKSREIIDFDYAKEKSSLKALKTTVFEVDEVVLFNTDIFHDVDNTRSQNERTILTLRESYGRIDFFGARKILFGY